MHFHYLHFTEAKLKQQEIEKSSRQAWKFFNPVRSTRKSKKQTADQLTCCQATQIKVR